MRGMNLGKLDRWEIIESHKFLQSLHRINGNNPRAADRFFDGVKDRLCRDPYWGRKSEKWEEIGIWKLDTREKVDPDVRPMIVYYTFDDTSVYLLDIRINDTEEDRRQREEHTSL